MALVLVLLAGIGYRSRERHRQVAADREQRQVWHEELIGAFRPMAADLSALMRNSDAMKAGAYPADQLGADLESSLPNFVSSRELVAALPELRRAPGARELYLQAARLHLEFLRVHRASVRPPIDPLKSELDLLGRRLRVLADRVYDRAGEVAEPRVATPTVGAVEFRALDEVPRWETEGLAAGPPLAHPSAPSVDPSSAPSRSRKSHENWLAQVREVPIPAASRLGAAIESDDVEALEGLAVEFATAERLLRATPRPSAAAGRRTAVLQLGLLVDSEAARAAHAAGLTGDDKVKRPLLAVARRLALIGDRLWDPALGTRSSGFQQALLEDRGL
jgi:hypothetical protein